MDNLKNFWERFGKYVIALLVIIAWTSITMNLLSKKLEQAVSPTPSAQGEYWLDKEETHVINVLASGALMPCDTENAEHVFSNLGSLVRNYDVSAVSVHSLIGRNSSRVFGEAAIAQGYGMFGLAYPDVLSEGKEGIDDSMAFWDSQNVRTSGTHTSTDTSNILRMGEFNGVSVIYLSYTDVLNTEMPENETYLVNVYNDEKTPQFVAKAAEMADVVIVSIVWKGEAGALPDERQRKIADDLADAGASIVIGYSGHQVQPACWIDDTLVFYSLGDLYSEQDKAEERIGALGAVTITKTVYGDKSRVELTNPKVDLVASLETEEDHNDIKLLSRVTESEMEHHIDYYTAYCVILQKMDDSIRIGGLN